MTDQNLIHKRKVHGRKQGRTLNKSRARVMDEFYPKIAIKSEDLPLNQSLDPQIWFSKKEIWFEIGFGNGERLASLLRDHPDIGYLGAEPFINGVAAFCKQLSEMSSSELMNPTHSSSPELPQAIVRGSSQNKKQIPAQSGDDDIPGNIRILMDDAMLLAKSLKPESLDGIWVLNPDPWPKTRHHKRRMISQDNLDVFAKIIKPGGQLVMTTDVDDLAEWMATQTSIHPAFIWTATSKTGWQNTPKDWIKTRYEIKQANHSSQRMSYLIFKRT